MLRSDNNTCLSFDVLDKSEFSKVICCLVVFNGREDSIEVLDRLCLSFDHKIEVFPNISLSNDVVSLLELLLDERV